MTSKRILLPPISICTVETTANAGIQSGLQDPVESELGQIHAGILDEHRTAVAATEESKTQYLNPDPAEKSFSFNPMETTPASDANEKHEKKTNPRESDRASASNASQAFQPLSERKKDAHDQTESEKPPSSPTRAIESVKEGSDYEDYGDYGWKASADETPLFGAENGEEKTFLDDRCVYVSTLLLWDRDYDFENITQEEILDKVTKALDKE
ncbi:unnamed protein product [Darwinula stevensoni]|uniref:Uncharacterized protein n=1 Tax=Darwinula stevensoni TaxID=69355 RepID=A0A7R8X273_9CRUS|nr:unnamed protein product [Darwinula stevensoni]CAG0883647.1 unnamed protein product [Darwinula stevensoni]